MIQKLKLTQLENKKMNSFKKPKSKPSNLLQQESSKLKEKLQNLREQVTQKKIQNQMNKTATLLQNNNNPSLKQLNQNSLSSTVKSSSSSFPDLKLHHMLVETKMQSLQQKLKEKGVKNYQTFIQLIESEIDEWKDIAVGWRIKLKKQLRICKQKNQSIDNTVRNLNDTIQSNMTKNNQNCLVLKQGEIQNNDPGKKQQNQPKNIEDIIKQRKEEKVFVPISRQIEELQQQEYISPQMTDQDQDVIIQSFMKVFQPRKGVLVTKSKISVSKPLLTPTNKEKKVNWSSQVERMQKEFMQKNHKIYPKQPIVKEAFISMNENQISSSQSILENVSVQDNKQAIRYCWKCFRKIDIRTNVIFRVQKQQSTGKMKYFCGQKCRLFCTQEVEQFQLTFQFKPQANQRTLDDRVSANQQERRGGRQDEEIQTIDLSIL